MDSVVIRQIYLKFIRYLYLFAIAIAPFYFGGERILAWGISGLLQSGVALALAVLPTPKTQIGRLEKILNICALICLGLLLVWAVFQLIPITSAALVYPVWTMTGEALDEIIPTTIAVSPDDGFLTLVKIMIVLLAFFNARKLYAFKLDIYQLILAVPLIALAYALVGVFWSRVYPLDHVWLDYSPYQTSLVSTFVNRNSFSQYLGIASICTLAYISHIWKSRSIKLGSFTKLHFYLKDTFVAVAFLILLFSTLLTCNLLTASRGGIYSSLAAFSIFFLAILRIVKDRYTSVGIYLIIVLAAGYFIYDRYAGSVGQRNLNISDDYSNRLELYQLVWSLVQTRPWTGYGLGGFESAFRSHKPIEFDTFGIWDRAHNVYLDAAVALGLPAAIFALGVVLTPLFIHMARLRERGSTLSILVLALYVQLSIHSLFDIGLQTGANAITVAALFGASLTHSKRPKPVYQ